MSELSKKRKADMEASMGALKDMEKYFNSEHKGDQKYLSLVSSVYGLKTRFASKIASINAAEKRMTSHSGILLDGWSDSAWQGYEKWEEDVKKGVSELIERAADMIRSDGYVHAYHQTDTSYGKQSTDINVFLKREKGIITEWNAIPEEYKKNINEWKDKLFDYWNMLVFSGKIPLITSNDTEKLHRAYANYREYATSTLIGMLENEMNSQTEARQNELKRLKLEMRKKTVDLLPECELKSRLKREVCIREVYGLESPEELDSGTVKKKISEAIEHNDSYKIVLLIDSSCQEPGIKQEIRDYLEECAIDTLKGQKWETAAVLYGLLGDQFNISSTLASIHRVKAKSEKQLTVKPVYEVLPPESMPDEHRKLRDMAWRVAGAELGNTYENHKDAEICFDHAIAYKKK
ncbi:MAG: hypothetical protein V1887_02890 [Candidatus Aenigmatarchaeota archaeon]